MRRVLDDNSYLQKFHALALIDGISLQINGESTANMTYEEAVVKLNSATQLNLEVLHNKQG